MKFPQKEALLLHVFLPVGAFDSGGEAYISFVLHGRKKKGVRYRIFPLREQRRNGRLKAFDLVSLIRSCFVSFHVVFALPRHELSLHFHPRLSTMRNVFLLGCNSPLPSLEIRYPSGSGKMDLVPLVLNSLAAILQLFHQSTTSGHGLSFCDYIPSRLPRRFESHCRPSPISEGPSWTSCTSKDNLPRVPSMSPICPSVPLYIINSAMSP